MEFWRDFINGLYTFTWKQKTWQNSLWGIWTFTSGGCCLLGFGKRVENPLRHTEPHQSLAVHCSSLCKLKQGDRAERGLLRHRDRMGGRNGGQHEWPTAERAPRAQRADSWVVKCGKISRALGPQISIPLKGKSWFHPQNISSQRKFE